MDNLTVRGTQAEGFSDTSYAAKHMADDLAERLDLVTGYTTLNRDYTPLVSWFRDLAIRTWHNGGQEVNVFARIGKAMQEDYYTGFSLPLPAWMESRSSTLIPTPRG